jgi:hypothetical protein
MMIEFAIVAVVSNLVLLTIIVLNARDFMYREDKWYEERQILLNRIENPQYRPPIGPAEKRQNLEEIKRLQEEADAFGLVGKIVEN